MNYIVHNPDFVLFTIDNVLTNKEISALQQAMARSRSLPEKDSLVCVGNTHPSRKVLTDFLMPSVSIQGAAEGGGGAGGGAAEGGKPPPPATHTEDGKICVNSSLLPLKISNDMKWSTSTFVESDEFFWLEERLERM